MVFCTPLIENAVPKPLQLANANRFARPLAVQSCFHFLAVGVTGERRWAIYNFAMPETHLILRSAHYLQSGEPPPHRSPYIYIRRGAADGAKTHTSRFFAWPNSLAWYMVGLKRDFCAVHSLARHVHHTTSGRLFAESTQEAERRPLFWGHHHSHPSAAWILMSDSFIPRGALYHLESGQVVPKLCLLCCAKSAKGH